MFTWFCLFAYYRYITNLFERQNAQIMLKKAMENENEEELREAFELCLNIGADESTIQIAQEDLLCLEEHNKLVEQIEKHLKNKNIKK